MFFPHFPMPSPAERPKLRELFAPSLEPQNLVKKFGQAVVVRAGDTLCVGLVLALKGGVPTCGAGVAVPGGVDAAVTVAVTGSSVDVAMLGLGCATAPAARTSGVGAGVRVGWLLHAAPIRHSRSRK